MQFPTQYWDTVFWIYCTRVTMVIFKYLLWKNEYRISLFWMIITIVDEKYVMKKNILFPGCHLKSKIYHYIWQKRRLHVRLRFNITRGWFIMEGKLSYKYITRDLLVFGRDITFYGLWEITIILFALICCVLFINYHNARGQLFKDCCNVIFS